MRSVKKSREYQDIYRRGRSSADKNIVLYALRDNELTETALGVSVSKKYGNSVRRHKFKRRIKEIVRLSEQSIKGGVSLVVIARVGAVDDYHELEASFMKLAGRLGVIEKR